MTSSRYRRGTLLRELIFIGIAVIWCIPFYFLVAVAAKPDLEVFQKPVSWPEEIAFENFARAWAGTGRVTLGQALLNSVVITVATVVILIAVGSLTAYVIARARARTSELLYAFIVIAIITPYQMAILPLYSTFRGLGLVGSHISIIILFTGLLIPMAVFLYTGFLRALPQDYEEAAEVDGANRLRIFVRVVFPLLSPVTATVAVMTGLIIWNDFFVQLIFLSGSNVQSISMAIYGFVGEYASRWNLVFAAVLVAILPVIGFYLFAQRHLIQGFTGGIKS
jgi:raffinose/stachyose/melibiose transport system permease protein